MKKIIFILILTLSTMLFNKETLSQSPYPYKDKWEIVDHNMKKQKPQSALKIIDEIYATSKKEENQDQILKCYIYYLKAKSFEEDYFETIVQSMESDIKPMSFPNSAVMHSMLGELYWQYYKLNLYKIKERTEISNYLPHDMKTWTSENFVAKAIFHYNASIKEEQKLQQIPQKFYEEIIIKGTKPSDLRPTLYDFLATRAINFYAKSESSITQPLDYFELNDEIYYAPAKEFADAEIISSDTLSLHFNGIKILQKWLKFRLSETANPNALIAADLKRLKFVENFSVIPKKNELFLAALKNIEKKYPNETQTGFVKLKIAKYYFNNANKYDFEKNNTKKYKNYFVTAKKIYTEIIEKYKNNEEITSKAQRKIITINETFLETKNEEVVPIASKFAINIKYKNINRVYFEMRKLKNYNEYIELQNSTRNQNKFLKKIRNTTELISSEQYTLQGTQDHQTHSTDIINPELDAGMYIYIVSSKSDFNKEANISYSIIQISNLSLIHQRTEQDGSMQCFVVNRKTGKLMPKVKAKIFYRKYNYSQLKYATKLYGTYTSDDNGRFIVKTKPNFSESINFELATNSDMLTVLSSTWFSHISNEKKSSKTVKIFTDRKIYRPGQTIYFKGIIIEDTDTGNNPKIVQKFPIAVTFYDVNWQKISKQKFVSNDFGSFNGSFQIPTGKLNGQMTISTDFGRAKVSVEEYKRPTFFAKILPIEKQYLVNDKITIKGEALNYSGVKITNAQVQYNIKRKDVSNRWWWYDFDTEETMIAHGITKTDENGKFEISFDAIPDLTKPKNQKSIFGYSINADITDINGETQSTATTINAGYVALNITSDIKSKIEIGNIAEKYKKIKISAQNFNNEPVDTEGVIEIYNLKQPQIPIKKRYWKKPDEPMYTKKQWYAKLPGNPYENEDNYTNWEEKNKIWTKNFDTKTTKEIDITKLSKFAPGVYKMLIKSKDNFGNPVTSEQFFILYSKNQSSPPYPTPDWYVPVKIAGEPGEKVKILCGSTNKTTAIFQLSKQNKIIKQETFNINNSQKLIEIPITEQMRGDCAVKIIFQSENRIYSHNIDIKVPFTNKKLNFEFATFRDKLAPGQKERWKIIVKDYKNNYPPTEILTTLYDASLDAIIKNSWKFAPYYNKNYSKNWEFSTFDPIISHSWDNIETKYIPSKSLNYSKFNWYDFQINNHFIAYGISKSLHIRGNALGIVYEAEEDSEVEAEADYHAEGVKKEEAAELKHTPTNNKSEFSPGAAYAVKNREDLDNQTIKIRKNFNETAFFYPDLRTNENGEFVISFTIPESLTKWNLKGLATTQDLKSGTFNKEIITQKPLMIMPNSPRFFRQNDTAFFAAKIANLSGETLNGTAKIEFFDEITGKKIDIISAKDNETKNFSVEKELNTLLKWEIIIPDDAKIISYKIVAKAQNFSDGEQKMIPVLTNRILVTEAIPLPVRAKETKNFKFHKLLSSGSSETIKTDKLTLEFTSNPAWYAVQALPYLIEYPYECSEQVFARYYANTIATHVANSSPKIKKVFDTWKNTQPEALLSNLEKNQELKQIILQETPWVLEAKNENQQKQRIALLFDINKMANEKNKAIKILTKRQTINGGYSWFNGMPESWYITQYIAEGIGHLKKLGIIKNTDKKELKIAEKAVKFTDDKMKNYYELLKKDLKKNELKKHKPNNLIIHYFYTRTFFNIKLSEKYSEAYNYFYNQLKNNWTDYNLLSQGMLAIIFYRTNQQTTAQNITASLKERAISHEELGMYWKNNTYGYFWYQNPIETQALMIEAFEEITDDKKTVDELKIWLLKNKQTNDWKTTTATAKAIYALLLTGGSELLENSQLPTITLGKTTIDPENDPKIETEAGTGYFKITFNNNETTPQMGKIKVVNKNDVVAWGALYWQYFENIDKITPHKTPLELKKDIYKEIITDRGEQLIAVNNESELQIGDKIIIRIELKVDRDMEYVHMKDMRAATFEPINIISKYKWQDGLGYYQSTKDASTNFFFDYLRKGTYIFEYSLRATMEGTFSNGITTIQCMYAPEFMSHSKGQRVTIK